MKITNRKILVTGGASGIGLGMVERFVADHNTVIICGRRADVLEEAKLKFPSIIIYTCDLSNANEREDLFKWVETNHPDLSILVNNAGVQNWMDVGDADFYKKAAVEISINIEAPIHLNALFIQLKSLEKIMNVTSGLAFVPLAKAPVYSATKAFFHSYTLSLRHLLKQRNIEVVEIIPPALNTDLGGKGLHDFAPPVSDFIQSIFNQMEEGKLELTFGFSDNMVKSGPEDLQKAFERMNTTTN